MSESTAGLDPDRLFPMEPTSRAIARDLYESVRELPIISPHGHVPAGLLREDRPFTDPSDLFLSSDHYVTRLLHAGGVPYDKLMLGAPGSAGRDGWRLLAEHWHELAGTASGYWLEDTFANVFGIGEELTAESADRIYDELEVRLREAAFTPRALFDTFRIDVLATTDDPLDELDHHAALRADPGFAGRVVPTFRPDRYLDPEAAGFDHAVQALVASNGSGSMSFVAYLEALEARRQHFIAHGAVSADHGIADLVTVDLGRATAATLFTRALRGELDERDARLFRGHMLLEMGRMSARDGSCHDDPPRCSPQSQHADFRAPWRGYGA